MTVVDAAPLLVESGLPLVAAPMAGGTTTPRLATAVADAGALAFLAGGYKTPELVQDEIAAMRASGKPFGVNLFAPAAIVEISDAAFREYARALQADADRYGLDLSATPLRQDDDGWRSKLDVLLADPVPVVSVTFGIPPAPDMAALRKVGTAVLVTVTSVDEARHAAEAGADGLVVQGAEAGGHSGTHDPRRPADGVSAVVLTRDVTRATQLPVVAAGGVDGPEAVAALMRAGATAVAVGTLLLRTDESGAAHVHKEALGDPRFPGTTMTRAFTGRPARALRNSFVQRHSAGAPLGYPAVHHLTRPLRQAAAAAGRADDVHLWAGTGYRRATAGPAASVVRTLSRDL